MRALVSILVLATSLAATPLPDPAAAVSRAKEEIAAGRHEAALHLLREATPVAAASTNLRERSAALSAIHFYSALANVALGNRSQAEEDLRSFLFYSPTTKLDSSRFPREFVDLFQNVQESYTNRRASPASFEDAYPGYPPAVSSSVWPLDIWGASSELVILGTEEEKEEWGRIRDDAARREFIERFWSRRDPDPATRVNEARVEFLARIAFADVAFTEAADDRGSLTDRGRVFVLLGPPQRVSIRPMNRREAWYQPRRTIDAGNALEQWTYFRDQLPKKLPRNELVIRFITEGGSMMRRMEHDFFVEKAIKDAPAALRHD
ncbi:MAG TPA: GWxTD domain-containing protein [Thermoanaerobaculia bacterium]|nr:GWxTD domain-containing protein [Thermoanaerobaculia bacterium]